MVAATVAAEMVGNLLLVGTEKPAAAAAAASAGTLVSSAVVHRLPHLPSPTDRPSAASPGSNRKVSVLIVGLSYSALNCSILHKT